MAPDVKGGAQQSQAPQAHALDSPPTSDLGSRRVKKEEGQQGGCGGQSWGGRDKMTF